MDDARILRQLVVIMICVATMTCSKGTPDLPTAPGAPDTPEDIEYLVAPPAGLLPWPHHGPDMAEAEVGELYRSLRLGQNFGAYNGTDDRSHFYIQVALVGRALDGGRKV